jgi:hypothetical protein
VIQKTSVKKAECFCAEITADFLRGEKSSFTTTGKVGTTVCYSRYRIH